jgi:hypothetical protein
MIRKKDYVNDMVEYVKKNLKKGYTKDSLRSALIIQGHSRIEVEKALNLVDINLADQAPILKTEPIIKYEVVEPVVEKKKPFWKKFFGKKNKD